MNRQNLWIFAYGSLLWNTGFDAIERYRAVLHGYSRSFCMRSIHYRGTPENPGLVLALVSHAGAICKGMALRVCDTDRENVMNYLRARELISSAYEETTVKLNLENGHECDACAFVMDKSHEQYCGYLPFDEQARVISMARGRSGENWEYLAKTVRMLAEIGIRDAYLEKLNEKVTLFRKESGH